MKNKYNSMLPDCTRAYARWEHLPRAYAERSKPNNTCFEIQRVWLQPPARQPKPVCEFCLHLMMRPKLLVLVDDFSLANLNLLKLFSSRNACHSNSKLTCTFIISALLERTKQRVGNPSWSSWFRHVHRRYFPKQ